MIYEVAVTNTEGLRLTIIVNPGHNEQPYDAAERIANSDIDHSRYAPWTAGDVRRVN